MLPGAGGVQGKREDNSEGQSYSIALVGSRAERLPRMRAGCRARRASSAGRGCRSVTVCRQADRQAGRQAGRSAGLKTGSAWSSHASHAILSIWYLLWSAGSRLTTSLSQLHPHGDQVSE